MKVLCCEFKTEGTVILLGEFVMFSCNYLTEFRNVGQIEINVLIAVCPGLFVPETCRKMKKIFFKS